MAASVKTFSGKSARAAGEARRTTRPVMDLETRATREDHQALRLWLRLLSCTVRIETLVRLRLRRDFNTTLPRFDLMAQLERSVNGLRMNELSQRLMVSGGNVTGITDQLEREGLVARTPCPGDHEQWIIEMLGGLRREEKETMIRELGKLKVHINTTAAMAAPASKRGRGDKEKS
jgi:DNA-binding MarR family transcriptional regulator